MVRFLLGEGSCWFFKFVFKRWLKKTRPLVEKKLRNNLANQALQTLQHFHLFSQTTDPEGQIAGWMSLLYPSPCTIPAFPESTSVCRGGASPGWPCCMCLLRGSGCRRCGTGSWHSQALPVLTCSCFVFPLEPSLHDGECFLSAVQGPSKRGRQPQPSRGDEGHVSAPAGRICWGAWWFSRLFCQASNIILHLSQLFLELWSFCRCLKIFLFSI